MMASLSGNLATMGPGVPYAIAAKFAHPRPRRDRPRGRRRHADERHQRAHHHLASTGDAWSDPRLIVLVLNNHDLNQVTWEQRVMEGDPKFEASQDLPDFPFADYAASLGLAGRARGPSGRRRRCVGRGAGRRPALVLEAVTDPDVPPLPPHITFKQAVAFAHSMAEGDVDRGGVIRQAFRGLAGTIRAGR